MPTPCTTPKCRGKRRTGQRYCFACARVKLKLMRESGYLEDISWIQQEEQNRSAQMFDGSGDANKQRRINREGRHGSRQVCGELMVSRKVKK